VQNNCPKIHTYYQYIFNYISLVIFVFKWVEAKMAKTTDVKVLVEFFKSTLFCRFDIPKAIISN